MYKYFAIEDLQLIKISGKDSAEYLHNRSTQNIKNLKNKEIVEIAFLDHKGKCEGYFDIFNEADGTYFLMAENQLSFEEISSSVLKFRIREKIELKKACDNCIVLYIPIKEVDLFLKELDNSAISYNFIAKNFNSPILEYQIIYIFLASSDDIKKCINILNIDSFYQIKNKENIKFLRFCFKKLVFNKEILPQSNFVDYSLWNSVARNKGCYVGQEIIEKVLSRGKPPFLIKWGIAYCSNDDLDEEEMGTLKLNYNFLKEVYIPFSEERDSDSSLSFISIDDIDNKEVSLCGEIVSFAIHKKEDLEINNFLQEIFIYQFKLDNTINFDYKTFFIFCLKIKNKENFLNAPFFYVKALQKNILEKDLYLKIRTI